MRIEAEQHVAAPPEAVFARLADFESFEARAGRRGIPVERLENDLPGWRIGVDWHGMSYAVDLQVQTVTPPEGYSASVATRGVDGTAVIAIAPQDGGSRLRVTISADGRGVAGRMVLQTLGFARPILEGRLSRALSKLAGEIEAARTA
jgi:carbon monoxide dehydrogenase subunit G